MSIDCTAARALLLEAEPHELGGEGESPLARHLRECAGCRGEAAVLLEGNAALDAALTQLARPQRATRAIALEPRRRVRPAWLAAPGLAAAAAVAALLLGRPRPATQPGLQSERIAQALFPAQPVARAPGRAVAVLKTTDPAVTVVWVY